MKVNAKRSLEKKESSVIVSLFHHPICPPVLALKQFSLTTVIPTLIEFDIILISVSFNQVDALSCYKCDNCAEVSGSTKTVNCATQCIVSF